MLHAANRVPGRTRPRQLQVCLAALLLSASSVASGHTEPLSRNLLMFNLQTGLSLLMRNVTTDSQIIGAVEHVNNMRPGRADQQQGVYCWQPLIPCYWQAAIGASACQCQFLSQSQLCFIKAHECSQPLDQLLAGLGQGFDRDL